MTVYRLFGPLWPQAGWLCAPLGWGRSRGQFGGRLGMIWGVIWAAVWWGVWGGFGDSFEVINHRWGRPPSRLHRRFPASKLSPQTPPQTGPQIALQISPDRPPNCPLDRPHPGGVHRAVSRGLEGAKTSDKRPSMFRPACRFDTRGCLQCGSPPFGQPETADRYSQITPQ